MREFAAGYSTNQHKQRPFLSGWADAKMPYPTRLGSQVTKPGTKYKMSMVMPVAATKGQTPLKMSAVFTPGIIPFMANNNEAKGGVITPV